jgi:hypothetical protein
LSELLGQVFTLTARVFRTCRDKRQEKLAMDDEFDGPRREYTALELLQAIYRDSSLPLSVRMRAARDAIPYEQPRLSMVAQAGPSFASALEETLKRRADYLANYQGGPALIEVAKPKP